MEMGKPCSITTSRLTKVAVSTTLSLCCTYGPIKLHYGNSNNVKTPPDIIVTISILVFPGYHHHSYHQHLLSTTNKSIDPTAFITTNCQHMQILQKNIEFNISYHMSSICNYSISFSTIKLFSFIVSTHYHVTSLCNKRKS